MQALFLILIYALSSMQYFINSWLSFKLIIIFFSEILRQKRNENNTFILIKTLKFIIGHVEDVASTG